MELKFKGVVGFREEDPGYPAANLARGGKWLTERKSRSYVNDITMHLDKDAVVNAIDIGNWGSSFISVEVSRIGLQRYETLLPSTELISARDALTNKNWSSVHMFSKEHFSPGIQGQKWNLIRVTCVQPFARDVQFGLSFFRAFSIPEKETPAPQPQLPPPGSAFAMMRNRTTDKDSPLIANRSEQLVLAALDKHNTFPKSNSAVKQKDATSSHVRDNSSGHTDLSHETNANHKTSSFHSSTQDSTQHGNTSPKTNNSVATNQRKSQTSCKTKPISTGSNQCAGRSLSSSGRNSLSPANIRIRTLTSSTDRESLGPPKNMKRRIGPPSHSAFNGYLTDTSSVQKAAKHHKSGEQLKQLQTPVTSTAGGHAKQLEIKPAEVLSDTDSDASTILCPLPGISPGRMQRDFDSDTETVILPLDGTKAVTPRRAEEFAVIEITSSPEYARSETVALDREELPGPLQIACPLCSDLYDASSIEAHAATCSLSPESVELICPVCCKLFPLEILAEHADMCAENTLSSAVHQELV